MKSEVQVKTWRRWEWACGYPRKRIPSRENVLEFRPWHAPAIFKGFPYSSVGKESACNAGGPSLIPGLGRSAGEGIGYPLQYSWASLVAQLVKNQSIMLEAWVWSLGWKDPLEKGMATHSSILALRIQRTEEFSLAEAIVHGIWKESDKTDQPTLPLPNIERKISVNPSQTLPKEEERPLPTSFYEARITLILKSEKDTTRKEYYRPIFMMNINVKF